MQKLAIFRLFLRSKTGHTVSMTKQDPSTDIPLAVPTLDDQVEAFLDAWQLCLSENWGVNPSLRMDLKALTESLDLMKDRDL